MNQRDFRLSRAATVQLSESALPVLMIGAVAVLIVAHLFILNPDDLSMKWTETPDLAMRNLTFANYRYIPSLVHWAISALGSTYFHTVALWSLLFAIGLYACADQLAAYVGLHKEQVPWIFAFVSVQSYWIDTYRFTLAYMHFALALLFIASSLYALNSHRVSRGTKLAVAAFAAYLSLITYQAFIFVLVFAPTLALFSAALQREVECGEVKRRLTDMAIVVFAAFAAAAITVKALGLLGYSSNSAERAAGVSQAIQNLPVYLVTIVDPFLSLRLEYSKLVPLHERLLFGVAILVSLGLCAMLRQKAAVKWMVFALLLASVAILPDPMTLPSKIFWPVPRAMAADSFFFVFLAFIMASAAHRRWPDSRIPGATLAIAGLLSLANQVYMLNVSYQQTASDRRIAMQVINDIRQRAPIHKGTELGISSTWKNPAQHVDYLLFETFDSTFTDDWSKLEILEDTLGFKLNRVTLAPSVCEGHASPWEIRREGSAIAVCMD